MRVCKRDGSFEKVSLDAIQDRLESLCWGLEGVQADLVAQKTCVGLYDGVRTAELDGLAAETAIEMMTISPDYEKLAARIIVSDLHKSTPDTVLEAFEKMHCYVNDYGEKSSLISDELMEAMHRHVDKIEEVVDFDKDYEYDYFAVKTLQKSYLMKIHDSIIERPQTMLMRVSLGIWTDDIDRAIETYLLMRDRKMTHATPTLFNAGTPKPQLSSCFLVANKGDSLDQIYDTLKECALISKYAGGIGIHMHNVRATGSLIRGTGGKSNGLLPLLRVLNNQARYVNQGGRRAGSIAVYARACSFSNFVLGQAIDCI